jgi:hypothetical protein
MREPEGLTQYDALCRMAERESRAASSLATRLRITRQATANPETVARAKAAMPRGPRPWEFGH